MRHASLTSFSLLVFVLDVAGCSPVDHLVASNGTSAGTAGAHQDDVNVAGATTGGVATGGANQVTSNAVGGASGAAGAGSAPLGNSGGASRTTGGSSNDSIPGTTAGGAASCTDLQNSKSTHSVEVTIKNERNTPVYVGNRVSECFDDQTLRLFDQSGQERQTDISGICSCEGLMENGTCPVNSCARSPLRRIDANSSITLTWNGSYVVNQQLPLSCQRTGSTITACSQIVAADPGKYKLMVTGSSDYGCADGWDPALCSCMETNSCPFYGSAPLEGRGDLLEPSGEFDLLSTDKITVAFTETTGTIPRKDGVPIGDCKEYTSTEQLALGCPTLEPQPMSTCSSAVGTTCSYGIDVSTGEYSTQNFYVCDSSGSWGPGTQQRCGQTCTFAGPNVVTFSGTDCSLRLTTSCDSTPDILYSSTITAQVVMNEILAKTVETCFGGTIPDSLFELELQNGCATRLYSSSPLNTELTTCFKNRFESVRLDCAMPLSCGRSGITLL
jgi:hypothetical protein